MTHKTLPQRIMTALYYQMVSLSEEIDRADEGDPETLRTLLVLLAQVGANSDFIAKHTGYTRRHMRRILTGARPMPTFGGEEYVAGFVRQLKVVLEAYIATIPRDDTPERPMVAKHKPKTGRPRELQRS